MATEQTYIMIKYVPFLSIAHHLQLARRALTLVNFFAETRPDGVQRGLVGEIIGR